MKYEHNPCRKIVEFLLLEHNNSQWKAKQKIQYNQYKPYSKRYINSWINDNLFGPTKIMLSEVMKFIVCPKTLQSQYKKFHSDLNKILEDPTVREIVELDHLFGYGSNEIYDRLNGIIKPRIVDRLAIKQYLYFFWNFENENGVFRPAQSIELIKSNRELTKAYAHILKYFNVRRGREKYENSYNLYNPDKPNLKNIIKVIDHTTFNQMDALDENNINKLETNTNIQVKNCIVLKTLKTIQNNSGKKDFSDIFDLEDKEIEK